MSAEQEERDKGNEEDDEGGGEEEEKNDRSGDADVAAEADGRDAVGWEDDGVRCKEGKAGAVVTTGAPPPEANSAEESGGGAKTLELELEAAVPTGREALELEAAVPTGREAELSGNNRKR